MYLIQIFLAIHSFILVCNSIGPGLSRLRPHMQKTAPSPASWESSSVGYSNEPNSYAYWNCHTIPPNMTLCKSVGYSRMVLPNFLQHESIREVIQQANVWVALVNTDCHPDIQRFLCSLYAPVCLKSHQEAKIPPCWELCDQVRNACLPRMRLFGFDWPEIVQCKQFPRLAESMCIPPQETTAVKCAPCEQAITLENIASSYCMADVVLKASFKDVTLQPNRASLNLTPNSRTRALKLTRKDGTVSTSLDFRRLRKRNRLRRLRNAKSRIYRHIAESNSAPRRATLVPSNLYTHIPQGRHWLIRSRRSTMDAPPKSTYIHKLARKRIANHKHRVRKSPLADLDGINELLLGCSTCSSLGQFTNSEDNPEFHRKRWLIMGRRVVDEKTQNFSNQVQVTFLATWDRDSPEFRRSLTAIRTQPVSHLCPKKPSVITGSLTTAAEARNLKISRSAPSELADAPSQLASMGRPQPGRQFNSKNPAILSGVKKNSDQSNAGRALEHHRQQKPMTPETAQPTHKGNDDWLKNHAPVTNSDLKRINTQYGNTQPYWINEKRASNGQKADELINNRLRYTQWLSRPRAPHWHNSNTNAVTKLESMEERRRRRRRERRLWRRKQKEAQLKLQANNSAHAQQAEITSNLRQKPINPYGNEDSSSSIWHY